MVGPKCHSRVDLSAVPTISKQRDKNGRRNRQAKGSTTYTNEYVCKPPYKSTSEPHHLERKEIQQRHTARFKYPRYNYNLGYLLIQHTSEYQAEAANRIRVRTRSKSA